MRVAVLLVALSIALQEAQVSAAEPVCLSGYMQQEKLCYQDKQRLSEPQCSLILVTTSFSLKLAKHCWIECLLYLLPDVSWLRLSPFPKECKEAAFCRREWLDATAS